MSSAEARRVSRRWIAALLAINALGVVLVVSAVSVAGAAAGTVVTVGSGSTTIGGTTTIAVTITVDPADSEFNAFDLTLTFDPALVADLDPMEDVSFPAHWSFIQERVVNDAAGTLDVAAVDLAPEECGSGCTLFTVTFEGEANGVSPLTLSGQIVGAGLAITPGAINAGSLQVGSSDTPTSATDTPTSATDTPTSATDTPTTATDTPTTDPGTETSTPDPGTATSTSEPGTVTATSTGTASETPDGTTTPTGTVTGTPSPDGTTTPTGTETETPTGTPTPTPTGTPGPDPDLFKVFVANAARDGTD